MNRLLAMLLALSPAACINTTVTNPDGTPPPGAVGVGGLSGDFGFPVTSAVENRLVDEFGLVVGYQFTLSGLGLSCAQMEMPDSGVSTNTYQEVFGWVGSADQEIAYLHIVPASDGGIVADGGFDVSTGTITLTYSNENQIAGSFDALFDDPNTGNPSELQGTFNVAYCP
jgi:hypothetical protein